MALLQARCSIIVMIVVQLVIVGVEPGVDDRFAALGRNADEQVEGIVVELRETGFMLACGVGAGGARSADSRVDRAVFTHGSPLRSCGSQSPGSR